MTSLRPRPVHGFCFTSMALVANLLWLSLGWAQSQPNADLDPRPLSYEDVFILQAVSDPRPSHDASQVAFVRTWMDRENDRAMNGIWVTQLSQSGEVLGLEPLTPQHQNASSPRWSPNDDRLAYVASGDIEMMWMDSGRTTTLTQLPQGPGELSWSPDGQWLAFVMFTKSPEAPPVSLPGRPEGASWAPPPIYIDQAQYRADGAGYLPNGYRQIYVIPATGGAPIQLTSGPYHHGQIHWANDSQSIFFSAHRSETAYREPLIADLYQVSIADKSLAKLNRNRGPHSQPKPSPNGQWIAYLGLEDRKLSHQANRLHVMKLDGSGVINLTEDLDRSIDAYQWLADGSGFVIQYDTEGTPTLAYQYLNGERQVIDTNLGGPYLSRPYTSGEFAVAPNGLIALTHQTTQRPSELAVVLPKQPLGPDRVLTDFNKVLRLDRDIAEVESFWYTSSVDGRRLQGFIMYPPGFDPSQRYPLILEIHGGPFAAYGPLFAMELQLMAAQGYVVLYTNPRGSTSYGEDFANLIHHNYPSEDFNDLMDGIDAVIERGFIDEDQLFITGGSGGGVLTTWSIGHTDRFKAAVAVNPVINWYSFVLNADFYYLFSQYWFPAMPWEDPDHYLKYSPISYVGNVTTPTLLFTGESDHRTPISETEQYYQALKLQGVETAMVRVPEASHALHRRPSQMMAKPAYIVHWFDRYRTKAQP
jgi:dipeptidyl aminopeptidase/acylaminoacyl peptidase